VSTLLHSTGRPTVAGVSLYVTSCCDQLLSFHDRDADPPDGPAPDGGWSAFNTWTDENGTEITHCRCGEELPPAKDGAP